MLKLKIYMNFTEEETQMYLKAPLMVQKTFIPSDGAPRLPPESNTSTKDFRMNSEIDSDYDENSDTCCRSCVSITDSASQKLNFMC